MNRLRALVCSCILWPGAWAHAQSVPPPLTPYQRDSLSASYAQCAAYFTFAWKGLARSGKTELAGTYHGFAKSAMQTSYELAVASRTDEMAKKVVEARYEQYLEAMLSDVGQDFSNISVIANKHGKRCVLAVSDSATYAREYGRSKGGAAN
jgi:hypothetical protein